MLPKIYGISAVVQIILSIILIKYFGLVGAVASMILNKPIQLLLTVWYTQKIFTFSYNYKKIVIMPLIYFFIFVAGEIFTFNLNHLWLYILEFISTVILVLIFFRNEVWSMILTFWNEIRSSKA